MAPFWREERWGYSICQDEPNLFFLAGPPPIPLSVKNSGFWTFSRKPVIKFPIFCMMVEGIRRHHLNVVLYLGKILIRDLRGIKCQKFRFLDIFSETGHQKFLIFCMMVKGKTGHHLNVVPYLGKILIWGLRGIKCQKFRFLYIFLETGH